MMSAVVDPFRWSSESMFPLLPRWRGPRTLDGSTVLESFPKYFCHLAYIKYIFQGPLVRAKGNGEGGTSAAGACKAQVWSEEGGGAGLPHRRTSFSQPANGHPHTPRGSGKQGGAGASKVRSVLAAGREVWGLGPGRVTSRAGRTRWVSPCDPEGLCRLAEAR